MKKKIEKTVSKALAFFLSALFIFEVLPTQIMADAYNDWSDQRNAINELIENPSVNEEDTADILYEVVEKRDEYTKVFKKSDGSFTAMISKSPIHYLNDGVWEEINNILVNEDGNFTNIANAFNVLLPTTITDEASVTVEANGSEISFSVNDIDSSEGNVENSIAEYDVTIESAEKSLANTQSSVTYEDVDNGTDIQYMVLPNAIKENIIVPSKNDLNTSYSFTINTNGLDYVLNEDGSLNFFDGDEIKFTIPRPVMTDSVNNFSYDIDVNVTNNNDNSITLTYIPSTNFTDKATYPLTIDPAIMLNGYEGELIEDTAVYNVSDNSTDPNGNYYNEGLAILVNKDIPDEDNNMQSGYSEIYTKINTDIFKGYGDGVVFTDVQYMLASVSVGSKVFVKEINEPVDFQTVTYNTKPTNFSDNIVDYYTAPHDFGEETNVTNFEIMHFDITEAFNRWMNGETNNGFALIPDNDFYSLVQVGGFLSNERTNAIMIIDFVYTNGYNSNCNYHSQDISRAGTGYVNDFTRSLSLIRNDISLDGNIMPVSIDMIYNSSMASFANTFNETISNDYKKQWITSYNRGIYSDNDYQIMYFTKDGSEIDFMPGLNDDGSIKFDDDGNVVFEESCGYSIKINPEVDGYYEQFELTRPDGYIERFNENGSLVSVTNPDYTNQHIDVVYDEDSNIDYITDGVGRKFDYIYNSNGLLAEINCLSANGEQIKAGSTNFPLKTTYTYNSNKQLVSVTFADGKSVTYTYDSNNNLVSAENIDNYKIVYTYDSLNKVTNVTEYAKNGNTYVSGNSISYEVLSPYQVKLTDGNSDSEIYQFNHLGTLNYVTDSNGNHLSMGTSGANSSYYILSDEGYANSTNLIVNPGFERSSNWNGSTVLFTRENNSDARTGDYAMKAKRASNPTTNFKYQDVNVYQGGTYTFSAYIKSVNNSNVNDANLYLRVAAYNASGTATVTKLEKVNNIDGEWQRYYITIDAPDGTKKIRVGFGFNDSIGEYYLDDLQLELANTPSEFNLIENGSFSNRTTNWSVSGSSTISNQSLFNAITPTLNVNGNFVAYQTIAVNGKKDDVFSLGAWFKGNFVKSDPTNSNLVNILMTESGELFHYTENRFTQIEASYQYTVEDEDGTTHTETDKLSIPFEQFITDWQFANDEFALKGDTNEITVLLRYENNLNPASFTDVQLIKENDAVVLDTETDASGENTETETCPCEQCEENDSVCRCADETSCTCVQCKRRTSINTTDSFGNTLSNSSFDGTKSIVTSTAYTSNGNYVESSTDADNATTTYSYDTLNGLLMSVTDPNGNEIDYIYDAFGLLTQVSLATNNQKSANYVYTNDRLTGISNNGTTYLISYNLWGELQSVSVGSQPIITYSYGEGASRSRITQVDYANGTTVCYSYDLAGNVIFVEVQSDDYYKSFNYEYDAQNNLSEISATDVRTVRYTDGRTDILDCDGEYIYSSYTDNNDFIEVINGVTYTTKDYDSQYDYTTGETVSKSDVTSSAGKTVGTIFKTDWFGRTTEAVVQTKSANNTDSTVSFAKITTQYGYPSYADSKTSDRVLYVTNRVTYGSTTQAQKKFYGLGYSYDSNGNITGEYTRTTSGSQSLKKSYFYDELNQLTRVNDITADKTYTYTYDNAGNIVEKKEYPYISDETITDIPDTRTVYSYDSSWGDKLVSYTIYDSEDNIIEQKNFNYDNIGNPTSIGADTLTWSGRELTSYTKGNKSIAYTYDENGLRSTKTVTSGNTTERYDYVWSDGRLISQSYTDNEGTKSAKFIYGSAGDVQGFIYNDVTYLYVKNLQGDIIAIVNENGDEVVKISYDVWGKPTYSTGSLGNNQLLGLFEKLSPFSYRGYCYDTDIELYYLQSRYYNPELCRFINTDDTNIAIQTQGDILGVNLFAYCVNNPINFTDFKGNVAVSPAAAALGFATDLLMAISHRKYNRKYDSNVANYINGQDSYPYNKIKYGVAHLDYNGCEIIAVYNALRALGKSKNLSDIIYSFELNGATWMKGVFGTKPQAIGSYLIGQGLKIKTFFLTSSMDKYVMKNRIFIICYAHSSGIHAVMAKGLDNGKILVYNRYDNVTTTYTLNSIKSYVSKDGFKLIIGYYIYK